MDWYYGSDVNDFLVPKDQDLLDRHPSPGCWSNWGVNANEGFNLPKKFVVMDFMDESFDNPIRLESSIHDRFNESLNNQIELESSLQDKDGSSSSSVCGGLPEKSFQQTALSCDQPNHQLQDLPRFKQTDDIFLYKLNFHSFDTWFCCLNCFGLALVYSACYEVECYLNCSVDFVCPLNCQLQKHTAASNSDDFLDKALPANVLDSYEQSSRDEVLNEQSSLEESILHDLEMVIGQFTEKTRICFRDALYRLARNNEHQHSVQDQEKDVDMKNVMLHMDQNQTMRSQEKIPMESETNCVDRVIANLMFNKMEYNMHGLPMMTSTVSSEQEVTDSNAIYTKNSKASNPAQKFHYPNQQKLPGDGEVPWFEISNQQKDMSSHIEFGNPMKKSFMLEFG
ncbi:hypothetical protein Ahy_B10g106237 [Arachis hypogaea]|uniref:Protein LNK3 n=2 Tax=Arachis TaxID=3817 RepID=A0A444XAK3_ARAHY|nr:hypothetical protein Ahy_B10g106237 [Arachis hypogaea]